MTEAEHKAARFRSGVLLRSQNISMKAAAGNWDKLPLNCRECPLLEAKSKKRQVTWSCTVCKSLHADCVHGERARAAEREAEDARRRAAG